MKLYELSTELAKVNEEIISADGEISTELEVKLDQLNLELSQKAQGIRKWFAILDGDMAALDEEIKRLQKIKKTTENLEERLKAYVKHNMEVADTKKIQTPIGTFTIQSNPPSVEVISADMIPEQFIDTTIVKTPNKARIKDAISEGYDVPGAKLVTDKTHLRVK